jgi:hypothetical protein
MEAIFGMKTKILIACLTTGLLTLGRPAWAARTSFESRHHARQTHRPAVLSQQAVSGVIPRAIRGGNSLQMLNPRAPAKYGTVDESVSIDPDVPGKVNGTNLVTISF